MILTVALCLATVALNAQTYVGEIEKDYFKSIPGEFTANGHPYVVYATFSSTGDYYNFSIYQSDFTTHVMDLNHLSEPYIEYVDYNSTSNYDLALTQTLFNTDDDFEYINRVTDVYYDTVYYNPYDFSVEERSYTKTINIKSSNGSTIWSFDAEQGFGCWCHCFKLENKYYLVVHEYEHSYESLGYEYDYEQRNHLYLISQSQGLTEVKTELPISVFPSIANRGQQITVELGEGNNAKEVIVVNGLGQVIKRVPVQEGQKQITIPTQELNRGLNVVNSRTQQGQGSCKIIVR